MNLQEIIKESDSYSEVARKLGHKYINGTVIRETKKILKEYDCSHFTGRKNRRKYNIIEKECPVCNNMFKAQEGHKREKQTCSYACSNVYFRSGPDNGNWSEKAYRTTCFYFHEKKCVCCEEKRAVDVHHLDSNPTNNIPENLIPLCPTHHRYWHSKYKYLIEDKVKDYVNNYIKRKLISLQAIVVPIR